MKHNKKGFTLIELIVVLAILAIISAIAVPTAFGAIDNTRVAADKASIDSMNSAIRVEYALQQSNATPTYKTVQEVLTAYGINLGGSVQSKATAVTIHYAPTGASGPVSFAHASTNSAGGTWETVLGATNLAKPINATS